MKLHIILLGFLGYLLLQFPVYAKVSATLDRNHTNLDGPVQLTITSDQEQAEENLDTRALEQDFSIVGRSSSTQVSVRNGKLSKESRIILSLLPKREGSLEIPALSIGKELTPALQLSVEATPNSVTIQAGDTHPGLIIETEWEHSEKAYVQGQINLIIRIFHQGNLLEASLDEPRPENTLMMLLGGDLQGASTRNGQQYQTIERRYALFPQQSGTLVVPPVALQVRVPDTDRTQQGRSGFTAFGRGKLLTLKSRPLSIEILPPASQFSGSAWLPSVSVQLGRSDLPEQAIQIGDAINMRINLSALGLTGKQLPEVEIQDPLARFKVYPDQPEYSNSADGNWVKGQRIQTFVLIPTEAGTLPLPSVQLKWWDRQNSREQTAELPALNIEVRAADTGTDPAGNASPAAPVEITAGTDPEPLLTESGGAGFGVDPLWKWVSLISLAGWALSIAYFVIHTSSRRQPDTAAKPRSLDAALGATLREIESAARINDAESCWKAIKDYAHRRWPENPPATPEAWAEQLQDARIQPVLAELDSSLYRLAGETAWTGEQLIANLLPLLRSPPASQADTAKPAVPELYPPGSRQAK